jgi:hypothetical protein
MTKVKIFKVVRVVEEIEVDENDLLTLTEAATQKGMAYNSLAGRLDSGSLTWLQFSPLLGSNERRYVLRDEVRKLKPGMPATRKGGPKRSVLK